MRKRIISLVLTVAMILQLCGMVVFAEEPAVGGSFGDDLTWALDGDGVLTISGTGAMPENLEEELESEGFPWEGYREEITAVEIENGVTTISDRAFVSCYSLTTVKIADSVTTIGRDSFADCHVLKDVYIGKGVTTVEDFAFANCWRGEETGEEDFLTLHFSGDVPEFVCEYEGEPPQTFAETQFICYYPASAQDWAELVASNSEEEAWEYGFFCGGIVKWIEETVPGTVIQKAACKVFDLERSAQNGRLEMEDGTVTSMFSYLDQAAPEFQLGQISHVALWYCQDEAISYFQVWQGDEQGEKITADSGEDGWFTGLLSDGTACTIKAFDAQDRELDKVTITPEEDTAAPQVRDFAGVVQADGSVALSWTKDEEAPALTLFFLDQDDDGYADVETTDILLSDGAAVTGTACAHTLSSREADGLTAGTELSMLIVDVAGNEMVYRCTLTDVKPSVTKFTVSDSGLIEIEATYTHEITHVWLRYSDTGVSFAEVADLPAGSNQDGVYTNRFIWEGIKELRPGSYIFKLSLGDDQYQSIETTVNVIIGEDTAPVFTGIAPEDNAIVYGTVDFAITAADDKGLSTIRLQYADEKPVVREVSGTSATETFAIDTTAMADGECTLWFTVTDTGDNTVTEQYTYTINNMIDPVTDLTVAMAADGVQVRWTASPDPDVTGYIVERRDGTEGAFIPCSWLGGAAVSYLDTSDLADGQTYTYRVYAVSGHGMSGEKTADITIDRIAPVISDVWPATKDDVTLCHSGILQIAASDNIGLQRAEVFYTMAGGEPVKIGEKTVQNATDSQVFSFDWDVSALSGKATLTYRVYDKAGNCTQSTADVTIRAYAAPTVPAGLTAEAGFRSAALQWAYTGDLQTLKQFKVYACDEFGANRTLLSTVKNYKYTASALEQDTHYFQVTAEDIYGVESPAAMISVNPVKAEKVAPKAVIQSAELTGVTGTAITFSGTGSSDNDAIASYTWDYGDGTFGTGVNGTHTYENAGSFTVTLTVTDRSGNEDTTTAAVTIYDTLGADATHARLTVSVMDGYKEGTPGVKNATVTVYNDDGFESSALTDGSGHAVLVVPKGTHTVTVAASGYGAKVQKIEVTGDAAGNASSSVYLAASGVEIMGGGLQVKEMTYEEIVEAGIDVTDPANNHVVRNVFEMRFQASPELAFDLDVDVMINSAGKQVGGTGFGWYTFEVEDSDDGDDEDDEDDDDDRPNSTVNNQWGTPKHTVGVFPVGESAFMVIYGQTHWLKEMFNVELVVFNNSYAEDMADCVATLALPEGLSLANLLEGSQHESVDLGTITYIGKGEGYSSRKVNWYVRGDAEGEYGLTAAVTGNVSGVPFEKTFTADKAVKVYAGSALKLIVTVPESAYAEKEYVVGFELKNVSDRPIYNLTFGLDSVRQFTAEYLSNAETGEVREVLDDKDFANKMTYGVPALEPGDSFNLTFKTTFLYEQEFVEFVAGKLPGVEIGYKVADIFVTTLDGSTTQIPVEIVKEPVEKSSFFQWIWDETVNKLKENAKEAVIEFIDDKVFKGIPVIEGAVKIFEVGGEIKDELQEVEAEYVAMVSVSEGISCVAPEEATAEGSTYALRRSAQPGVMVYTDAEHYEISADGRTMKLLSEGKLYVLRNGATVDQNGQEVEPEIHVTTHYIDTDGAVQEFTRTLLASEGLDSNGDPVGGEYLDGLQAAAEVVLEEPALDAIEVPAGDEIVTVTFPHYMVTAEGEIITKASNTVWSVSDANGEAAGEGMLLADGTLAIDSAAKAGTYTVKLAISGAERAVEKTITLIKDEEIHEHSWLETWSSNEETHWHQCACGEEADKAAHDFEAESDLDCNTCGYVRELDDDKPGDDDDKPGSGNRPSAGSRPGASTPDMNKQERPSGTKLPFRDVVEEDWFCDSARLIYDMGLMNGTSQTTFSPHMTTSRAMIVTMLWRLEDCSKAHGDLNFSDVGDTWYTEAVCWAAERGIIEGISDTLFAPDASVTREQLAVILYRYAGAPAAAAELDGFRDAASISAYARQAMSWAVAQGILRGKGDGILDPTGTATRAEVAQMFCNYISG